ncbi:MAG TPA: universal stress protein [Steroidobacteraceae bacterium]|jgi:universal stress protein E|nr:universal stress protein [Steroidobacteraceae bacterium]
MEPLRRILFAVKDPERPSQPGVDKAIHIAKQLGASLELFNAISTPVFLELQPLTGTSVAELRDEALASRRKRLEKLVARARRRGVKASCSVEWDYPPHEAIIRRAETCGADLIIAEYHEGKRLKPWLLRLTDWELLRNSRLPVLLLRSERRWRKPVVLAAVDPSHARDKPARLDTAIVDQGKRLARALGGKLEVMHANNPSAVGLLVGDPAIDGATVAVALEEQQRLGRKRFAKFADRSDIPQPQRHVVAGDPATAIPRLARALDADLVVMGAVSRSGLKRVFIGNTAEKILGSLPCDVLVIKPSHFRSRIARKPRGMRVAAPSAYMPLTA